MQAGFAASLLCHWPRAQNTYFVATLESSSARSRAAKLKHLRAGTLRSASHACQLSTRSVIGFA
jgi:hypothetical protein